MSGFRRWYFYIVAAISLQAVTWAAIALLRNILAPALGLVEPDLAPEAQRVAFQISVILIGLPMFLVHWRWAGRGAGENGREGDLPARFLYLYFMIGAFLAPLLANANGFLQSLLRLVTGTPRIVPYYENAIPDRANLIYTAVAILVLSLMLFYHARLLRAERRQAFRDPLQALLHRLFLYFFSVAGLFMTTVAAANVLSWVLASFGDRAGLLFSRQLIDALAALLVGLPLWLIFWRAAQRLYRSVDSAEQNSLLRKAYLYIVIFFAVLSTVGAATALLAGFSRRLLDLEPEAGSGIVISTLVVAGITWFYHALVLREDARDVPLGAEQAGLRRLYWYLVAGVGLLALLIGLGGLLGVLFDAGDYIVAQQRENLAWFLATLLAGLAVWVVPWRKIQRETAEPGLPGALARASTVRRFYLYFFLLLATLTFLIGAIFILSRLLTILLGEALLAGDVRDMSLAAAYAIMAALVWLYHGWLLRGDRQALEKQEAQRAAAMRVVVVDDGDGRLGRRLMEGLAKAIPGARITPVGLTGFAAEMMEVAGEKTSADQILAEADIIIGPWSMAAPHAGLSADESIEAAIAASPARKLILPRPAVGWEWIGLEPWELEAAVREAADAVAQIISGETAMPRRPVGPGMIILLIVATLIILVLITSLLGSVLPIF